MALIRGKVEEIPRDAVRLSEEEAVHYQFGRLKDANMYVHFLWVNISSLPDSKF